MRTRIRRLALTTFALIIMSFGGQELRAGGSCTLGCTDQCADTQLEGDWICDQECMEVIGAAHPYVCEEDAWQCAPNEVLEKCVQD